MLQRLFAFLAVMCWALAPAGTTRAGPYALILLYAAGAARGPEPRTYWQARAAIAPLSHRGL